MSNPFPSLFPAFLSLTPTASAEGCRVGAWTWTMSSLAETESLQKADSCSSSHQSLTAAQLRVGPHEPLLSFRTGTSPWLALCGSRACNLNCGESVCVLSSLASVILPGFPHDFLVSRSFHSCPLRGLLERGRGVLWLSPFELRTLQALTLCALTNYGCLC